VLQTRDPVLFDPWIRDPEHFSDSLETVFRDNIFKFFDADPGTGISLTLDSGSVMEKFGSGIRDKHSGSTALQ
jgi:hypothetical protein